MRRVLNPLLGRNFKSSNFRRLVQSAISRLQTLKSHHHGRYNASRNDAVSYLQDDRPKIALSRCEQMIKHQDLLDVYGLIEGYLNLLMERIDLLQRGRECPDELKEAASSVIFAATRCKDFPELEEIKSILNSRFGKEFTVRAIELRNNIGGVNDSIKHKLSTRKPDVESKMNLLTVIASENGFTLQLNEQGEPTRSIQTRQPNKQQNRGVTLTTSPYRTRSSSRKRRR